MVSMRSQVNAHTRARLEAELQQEVGQLPPNHYNAWIRLPPKLTHQTSYARHEDGTFSTKPLWRDLSRARGRYDRQHGPHKGWRSKWHPKTLDYRTVDELGLPVSTLNELSRSYASTAKQHAESVVEQMVVEGAQLRSEGDGSFGSAVLLTENKSAYGEIKPIIRQTQTQCALAAYQPPQRPPTPGSCLNPHPAAKERERPPPPAALADALRPSALSLTGTSSTRSTFPIWTSPSDSMCRSRR